ncbi:MAG TPA: prolyl oligopeptidase family serine peptidase [Blastocatellia bacterium]|nr:prolyl oligopeptidase family serine peptidase [Blastocatellia bacterium]
MRHSNKRYLIFVIVTLITALSLLPVGSFGRQTAKSDWSTFTFDDMLDVSNVNAASLSNDGHWLAATTASLHDRIGIDNARFGDPTYIAPAVTDVLIIDTQTAKTQKLFPHKEQVRNLKWSPDGNHLAMMVLKGDVFEPRIWDRATNQFRTIALPDGWYAAENSDMEWSADGSQIFLTLHSTEWRKKAKAQFDYETNARIVVHSSKEPFLAWDDLRRLSSVRSLVAYDVKSGQTRTVLPEDRISSYSLGEDGTFLAFNHDITRKTDYDVISGTENEVEILPLGGQPRTIVKSTKGVNLIWSRDGRHYAYSKGGNIFVASIDDREPRQLTGKKGSQTKDDASGAKPDAEKSADKAKESFSAVRLSHKGDWLIASNKEGLWLIDTNSGAKELFLKTNEEDKESPRYQVLEWTPDASGIYLSYASRTKWERGIYRYNVKTKQMEELLKDSQLHSGFQLSKDGSTFVFNTADGNHPGDLYAADANLKNIHKLTDANPQLKEKKLGKTDLISYLDADGNKLYGVVYYPPDFQTGKKYPTVFNLYEQFFDDTYNGTLNVLAANGYVVVQPSVNLEIGHPGESWVKGVTAAANKLIEMGVTDLERLGVMGTSYGGYATNLLITQTNRFKAAVNISGKVDMISFYTDSPRFGVRNIHAPEKSQDRIGATLWQAPEKYIQHSAIFFADRIKTPLLLICGEEDSNVPPRQLMEMYYAMRRLDKEVEWVSYTYGGHGMPTSTVEEAKDFHQRIIGWFDEHLKGDIKKKDEASSQF